MSDKGVIMRKIIISCTLVGILILIISMKIEFDIWIFLDQMILISAMIFGLFFCKKKLALEIMNFFSIWVTMYNVMYIILKAVNAIDLYNVPWRIPFQLIIPFIVSFLIKRIHEFGNNEEL